jgi:dihydroorotase/N-acyl-D-amino-acid deacylase
LLLLAATTSATEQYDLVITGGHVLDGSGRDALQADLGVRDGVIVRVGALDDYRAARSIDATGLAVAPGFIDLHSHADYAMRDNPLMPNLLQQGITTVLAGNCGTSPLDIADTLAFVEDTGTGPNMGFLVGHNSVRKNVMGEEDRLASPEELIAMQALVARGMTEGAFGLSTGLKYVPGVYSDTGEVVALARAAAGGGGIYASHLRDEGAKLLEAMAEAIAIGDAAGMPVHISHHKAIGTVAWGSSVESLAMIDAARERGLDVTADQYPYTASSTRFAILFPPW